MTLIVERLFCKILKTFVAVVLTCCFVAPAAPESRPDSPMEMCMEPAVGLDGALLVFRLAQLCFCMRLHSQLVYLQSVFIE